MRFEPCTISNAASLPLVLLCRPALQHCLRYPTVPAPPPHQSRRVCKHQDAFVSSLPTPIYSTSENVLSLSASISSCISTITRLSSLWYTRLPFSSRLEALVRAHSSHRSAFLCKYSLTTCISAGRHSPLQSRSLACILLNIQPRFQRTRPPPIPGQLFHYRRCTGLAPHTTQLYYR